MGHLNMDSPQAIHGGAGSPASSPAWQGAPSPHSLPGKQQRASYGCNRVAHTD